MDTKTPVTVPLSSGPPAPARSSRWRRFLEAVCPWVRDYFRTQDPTFWVAITPALILGALVYVRSPLSNYIFDEQEALLANPYVNDRTLGFWASLEQAFRCDFWGLPPTRSIGSYRPIPNLIWRALWQVSKQPWLPHWVNVIFHACNAALVSSLAFTLTRQRAPSWLAGTAFLLTAVVTEAVSGVVGIADVLGGFGVLMALASLRLPWWGMPAGVFAALCFGLFSKESCLVAIPLVPWVALVAAPALHPGRPLRWLRPWLALGASVAALVAYTAIRKEYFQVTSATGLEQALPEDASLPQQLLQQFLAWFRQPKLPADPINNPLGTADAPYRIAGALRVYWRGLAQVVLPLTLSGDYSFPQEPVPERLVFTESVLGAGLMIVPPVIGVLAFGRLLWLKDWRLWRQWWAWSLWLQTSSTRRDTAPDDPVAEPAPEPPQAGAWLRMTTGSLLAIGLVWVPLAYFPHSNIAVVLPTVRAERFWYLPVIGMALLLSLGFSTLARRHLRLGVLVTTAFFAFQLVQARIHALHYTDDLIFWRATAWASPRSAKAHLNHSVMVGARGQLEERLQANATAKELAPRWAMAHVYYGDTLCRMGRVDEAWPHYVTGWELAPNDSNLIALGLQCLWDKKAIDPRATDLLALADKESHRGTWLAYLASQIVYHGAEHGGVERKYRPRGYNEGPKEPGEEANGEGEAEQSAATSASAGSGGGSVQGSVADGPLGALGEGGAKAAEPTDGGAAAAGSQRVDAAARDSAE